MKTYTIQEVINEMGKRLSLIRKNRGLNQKELAYQIGVNINTIYRLENGKNISVDNLVKVLYHFDLEEKFIESIPNYKSLQALPKNFTKF